MTRYLAALALLGTGACFTDTAFLDGSTVADSGSADSGAPSGSTTQAPPTTGAESSDGSRTGTDSGGTTDTTSGGPVNTTAAVTTTASTGTGTDSDSSAGTNNGTTDGTGDGTDATATDGATTTTTTGTDTGASTGTDTGTTDTGGTDTGGGGPDCTPIPRGLAGHWTLDEVAGPTSADAMGLQSGTWQGTPTPSVGHADGALTFDNLNDVVVIADRPAFDVGDGDFSLGAWVRTTGRAGTDTLIDKRDPSGRGYSFYLFNGAPGLQLSDSDFRNFNTVTDVADGAWHHVGVAVDRDRDDGLRFYVDGAPIETGQDPRPRSGSLDNADPVRLGTERTSAFSFAGDLDEPFIAHGELSAADFAAIFAADSASFCAGACTSAAGAADAHWPLEQVATSSPDAGGSLDLSTAAAVTSTGAVVRAGARFDGSTGYFSAPDDPALDVGAGDFSLSLWLRSTDTVNLVALVDKRQVDGTGYHLFMLSGELGLQLDDGAGFFNFLPAAPVADGAWHHIAVAIDRDDTQGARFYVDGLLLDELDPTVRMGSLDNDGDFFVGRRAADASGFFDGSIDELRFHKRSLSAAEVQAEYDADAFGVCRL